ncbi:MULTISPECIES: methyltransferase domain-containing protein [Haloarcula]|uniref:methyltransferase domain-containing protein n=1 Tax=Haloarcula TaxID=2237 RepID=UPI0023EE26FE|nr:methyltransferase domain-containing protein [Halomicroarcula sp. XH51]
MPPEELDIQSEATVSVLFLDVRNFTLLLDNYDSKDITEMLDFLFSSVRDIVTDHGGTVDKIVGDGMMVVFEGDDPGTEALRAATEIHQNTTGETERTQGFGTIEIGIGISTGTVNQASLADVDSTVIGRCVNIAARLEALCKKFDASILFDAETYRSSSVRGLTKGFIARKIPDQNLRGIRKGIDVYHLCDTHKFSEEYIRLFNEGVEQFVDQNYEAALSAFTEAYTRDERYTDQALLNHFTNSCLEHINNERALFRNPDRYEEHSTTQERQSLELEGYIDRVTLTREFDPEYVLDVGCGTGKVTQRLAKSYPDSTIVGLDTSRSAVAKARTEHAPERFDIEYKHAAIENYCPDDERGRYELIFSNSAMHWVEEQHHAYANLRRLITEDGLLAIHQGHEGTYKELHQVTVDVLEDFGYDSYFENLSPPLDLIYYTEEAMRTLLERHDFDPLESKVEETTAPDTIIEDFAEASLNAYCDRLENDSQRTVFREQFKKRANRELDTDDVTVRRIYVIATPA